MLRLLVKLHSCTEMEVGMASSSDGSKSEMDEGSSISEESTYTTVREKNRKRFRKGDEG